jgi:AcrR family transcriptional regulator
MEMDQQAAPARGRPRSEAAGPAILAAARDLVSWHGYAGVTTDMIAKAAGTGKQTIYRRWPSKADLVLDAFAPRASDRIDEDRQTDMPVEQALVEFLTGVFAASAETGNAMRGLIAYAQEDKAFRAKLLDRIIRPQRQALRALLEHGVEAGELSPRADFDATVAAVFGAMWYRLMLDEARDGDFAARLAAFATGGLHRAAKRQLA